MKKFLVLLLTLAVLPIMTSCGSELGLKNYARDYNTNIASNVNLDRVLTSDSTGKPNYALEHFSIKFGANVQSAINSKSQYKYLTQVYEPMVYNALSSTYYLAPDMATKEYDSSISDEIYDATNVMFSSLEHLLDELNDLDRSLNMETDPLSAVNLAHLKLVYIAYEDLVADALTLSQLVISAYEHTLPKALLEYSYTSGSTQTSLYGNLLRTAYINRYIATRDYYYAGFYNNNVPSQIIKSQNGFATPTKAQSLTGYTSYAQAVDNPIGTTPLNASKIENNATTIKANLNNLFTATQIVSRDYSAFVRAQAVISFSQAIAQDYNRLTLAEQDALYTMQNYIHAVEDYHSLFNTTISLCY